MPVRNQNWYDLQAGRRYPLDDRSTGLSDTGAMLDDSILVDCHIRFPSNIGAVAFVQAITVSNTLVTVLVGVADEALTQNSVRTIAAVSVTKPAQLNKNYAITALVPGVAGWVVFGAGIATDFTARYTAPSQSLLLPRCARAYRPLPIPTIGRVNLGTALTGIVKLEALAPVVAERKTLTIADKTVNAIEFRLAGNLTNVTYNPYSYFLGTCGQRPESGTCPKQPIESINGIVPDCNGNITITGDGIDIYPFVDGGGLGLDVPFGLADICDKPTTKPPRQGVDECVTSSSSSSSASSTSSSSTAGGEQSSSSSVTIIDDIPPNFSRPFCQPFTDNLAGALVTRSGRFALKTRAAPAKCQIYVESSSSKSSSSSSSTSSSSSSVSQPLRVICASDDVFNTNIATLRFYPTDWASNCTISLEFKIAPGVTNNAGLVFNYQPPIGAAGPTYMVAVVDADRGTFMLLRYNGSAFVAEYTLNLADADFALDISQWHKIAVTPVVTAGINGATVYCTLTDNSESQQVAFTVAVANYGVPTGASGLFADRAYAYFNNLTVE